MPVTILTHPNNSKWDFGARDVKSHTINTITPRGVNNHLRVDKPFFPFECHLLSIFPSCPVFGIAVVDNEWPATLHIPYDHLEKPTPNIQKKRAETRVHLVHRVQPVPGEVIHDARANRPRAIDVKRQVWRRTLERKKGKRWECV